MQKEHSAKAILEISDLAVSRGENLLIDGLSFSMEPGDTVWVAGSNGIGKTSMLKCIAGLLRPENGQVLWDDIDVHKYGTDSIGYQGHHDGHKPNLTALESLQFWKSTFASDICPIQTLEKVGLSAQSELRAKGLSAGQSRRLALARLILKQARLWILDEPAAAMDAKGRQVIRALVADHVESGGCALIASHTPPEKIGKNTRVLTLSGADYG